MTSKQSLFIAACLSAAIWILPTATPAFAGHFDSVDSASVELLSASNLPDRVWNADVIRELADKVSTMPDFVAARALWLAATAPPSVDATTVFARGIESRSPVIRGMAASFMAGMPSSGIHSMLISALAVEPEIEIIQKVVEGMSRLPRRQAVCALMEIMLSYNAQNSAVAEAGNALRRLTEADVPNNASAWRDWWLDNEDDYRPRFGDY